MKAFKPNLVSKHLCLQKHLLNYSLNNKTKNLYFQSNTDFLWVMLVHSN